MSVAILIERPQRISLEEWRGIVFSDAQLRIIPKPDCAKNPTSGEVIQISAGDADCEIHAAGQWQPFLCWQRGRLTMKYLDEFEDPANPLRQKVARIAKSLGAVIGTDAGDEALEW